MLIFPLPTWLAKATLTTEAAGFGYTPNATCSAASPTPVRSNFVLLNTILPVDAPSNLSNTILWYTFPSFTKNAVESTIDQAAGGGPIGATFQSHPITFASLL